MKKTKKNTLLLLSYITISLVTNSQNVTSPYSILGIGDIDNKDYGRYFISGNTAIARRDESSYNYANPASLSSLPLKTIHFDIVLRGRNSSFLIPGEDTSTSITKDFTVKRVALIFKLTQKTGIAVGLKQYSSVNYKFRNNEQILDGNTNYTKYVDGNGGINNVYLSAGTTAGKHFSAGLTASWLFGSLQRTTQYYSSAISLDIQKQENDFYNGLQLSGGIQYYSLPGKRWKHIIGITGSITTGLKGQLTSTYSEGDVVLNKEITDNREFKLPVSVGFGYSASKNNKLTISVEGNYYHWKYQKIDYKNSYTSPSLKVSAGIDYSFKQKIWQGVIEKSFVGMGISAENSYIRINGQKLWDYSLSFGGGINPLRSVSLYSGVELGIKGQKGTGQIKETYTQYVLGITIKDIWIGTKKYGRYN
ncbi:MAG: hypothetical protein JNK27_13725 [Chitinophagaceae bacterium]|nr:hypothetical protein [Chitinophagaceae bacterium]